MAAEKVEAWKKTAAYVIGGLCKEIEGVVKEFAELEKLYADLDKRKEAAKSRLTKVADDVGKRMSLDSFPEEAYDEVHKFENDLAKKVEQKASALKAYGTVYRGAAVGGTAITVTYSVKWLKK